MREPPVPEARDIIELDQRQARQIACRPDRTELLAQIRVGEGTDPGFEKPMRLQSREWWTADLDRGVDVLGLEIYACVPGLQSKLQRRIARLEIFDMGKCGEHRKAGRS